MVPLSGDGLNEMLPVIVGLIPVIADILNSADAKPDVERVRLPASTIERTTT